MKNFILLLLAVIMVSCNDSEINQFALQANIDDEFYKASEVRGLIGLDGDIIIEGSTQIESMTFQLSKLSEGAHTLGRGFPNSATFKDFNGSLYQTEPNGYGVVTISNIDKSSKTFSGTFHFSAILEGVDTVYVSKGFLYNVPYDGGELGDPTNAGTFFGKVNNEPFVPTMVTAAELDGSIEISGTDITQSIVISVPSTVQVGAYTLPQNGYEATYQNQDGVQSTTEGTITIIEHDPSKRIIKGAFSFLTEQSEITEGQFEVVYQ